MPEIKIGCSENLISANGDALTAAEFNSSTPKFNAALPMEQEQALGVSKPFTICQNVVQCLGGHFDTLEHVWDSHPIQTPQMLLEVAQRLPSLQNGRRRIEVVWRTCIRNQEWPSYKDALSDHETVFLCFVTANFIDALQFCGWDLEQIELETQRLAETLAYFEFDSCVDVAEYLNVVSFVADHCLESQQLRKPVDHQSLRERKAVSQMTSLARLFQRGVQQHMELYRRLFLTKRGLLGIGPRCAAAGDQVWVLRGAQTPFVVTPTEKDTDFKFVGDSYILDHMHGEILGSQYDVAQNLRHINII